MLPDRHTQRPRARWRRGRAGPRLAHPRVAALGLCLALGVGACAPAPVEPLRIGISLRPATQILYLAQEKGLFAEAGAPVRLVEFGAISDLRRAFERGQLAGAIDDVFTILDLGEPPRASDGASSAAPEPRPADVHLAALADR